MNGRSITAAVAATAVMAALSFPAGAQTAGAAPAAPAASEPGGMMGHGGMMGGGGMMGHGGMMGGGSMMDMMGQCQRMMGAGGAGDGTAFHLPPGNSKLEAQMRAEMMQKMGEIAAKYANRIKDDK